MYPLGAPRFWKSVKKLVCKKCQPNDQTTFFLSAPPPLPTPYFFTYRVFSGNLRFFSYTICLSPDCYNDVDMTVRPPKRTALATLDSNQSFLEDDAVTSLYHQTNNLGSLSFISFLFLYFYFLFIYFLFIFFVFLVKHIYTIQNNKISQSDDQTTLVQKRSHNISTFPHPSIQHSKLISLSIFCAC